jgi:tRNA (adenine57-N1/adenine58-N1)-methyltransferase
MTQAVLTASTLVIQVQHMSSAAAAGDVVLLVSPDRKHYLVRLERGGQWFSHRGSVRHDDILGMPLGRTVNTQHGHAFLVLEPSTQDLVHQLPRTTQIIYSKDAAQIVMRLSLFPGRTVVEAGTGSGGLTMMLARSVMPTGHVYSYETRPESYDMAVSNLEQLGLSPYVTIHNQDISTGFHERDVDAVFLDLREPWRFLEHAWNALKGSGFFGALLPTTNQVSELLQAMPGFSFGDIAVEELLLRSWKPVAGRLRPDDRMVAHSAFLLFARKIAPGDPSLAWMPEKKRRAYLGKLAMAEREAALERSKAQDEEDGEESEDRVVDR